MNKKLNSKIYSNAKQKYKRLINRECPAFGNTLLGTVILTNFENMKDKIEVSVVLADAKNPAIKNIGKSDTLGGAKKIKDKRRIQPNQRLWIGKYVNGVLRESFQHCT